MARLPSEHPFSLKALLHQAARLLSQRGGAAWEEGAGGDGSGVSPRVLPPGAQVLWDEAQCRSCSGACPAWRAHLKGSGQPAGLRCDPRFCWAPERSWVSSRETPEFRTS